jgi:primosomal replication protein N
MENALITIIIAGLVIMLVGFIAMKNKKAK